MGFVIAIPSSLHDDRFAELSFEDVILLATRRLFRLTVVCAAISHVVYQNSLD